MNCGGAGGVDGGGVSGDCAVAADGVSGGVEDGHQLTRHSVEVHQDHPAH